MVKITGAATVLCILIQFHSSWLQDSSCGKWRKCNECIKRPECAWCSQQVYLYEDGSNAKRCDTFENLVKFGCNSTSISNPNPDPTIPKSTNTGVNNEVQVAPQEVKLELRPGKPVTIQLTVRPAKDYPVDLYYVMDLSSSMFDDLQNLKTLAVRIAKEMKEITKNFHLGFGSFVDKTAAPFTKMEKQESCRRKVGCTPTYGFRHSLKLTSDGNLFEEEVKKQTISGNIDTPEGGFDALMQVATCEHQIGWRPRNTTRRLVLMATDAQYHLAGDGKIAGIIKPNDEKCHLLNGEYTHSALQDYPSIAQLHTQLKKQEIHPIFAVCCSSIEVDPYKSLSKRWSDLQAVTNTLSRDSSNIVQLIKDSYKQIVSTVVLSYKAPYGIKIKHTANCGKFQTTDDNGCKGVGIGDSVTFDVTVTLEQCPEDSKKEHLDKKVIIRVPGFGEMDLDIDFICKCKCEEKWNRIENSTLCNNGGDYACGVCNCHEGRYGSDCECDNPFDDKSGTFGCKKSNSTEEPECSGRGQCICGVCHCNKGANGGKIYGDRCQCDDFNCLELNGIPCGGPERGTCDCGNCVCKDGWMGTNCGKQNCSLLDFQCKRHVESDVCSGRGTCDCGRCKCDDKYTGVFCEECPTCEGGICSRNKDCIVCTAGIEKRSLEDCKKLNRCEAQIESVTEVNDISKNITNKAGRCDHRANDCYYLYSYKRTEGKKYKLIVEEKCTEEPNVLLIILATIGGILLLGLLLLLVWKLMISIVDRREYQRFQNDLLKSKKQIHESALYEGPITTVENITYAGRR